MTEETKAAVAAKRERWETAMRDVLDDIWRRDQACQRINASLGADVDGWVRGKQAGYAHAAEMLGAALRDLTETP